jgi:hypothetical protein
MMAEPEAHVLPVQDGDCEFIPITRPPKPVPVAAGSETTVSLASLQPPLAGFWARFLDVLLADGPRGLLGGSAIAVLLYVLALLGRESLHLIIPGPLRYLTFFPALMAAGFLCGLLPSMALTAAFAVTGFLWIDSADTAQVVVRLTLALVFVLAGVAVITPASYAVRARHHLKIRDERLALLNGELRHRIKNLFSVVCSICTLTIKATSDKEEISRNIIGRIQAIASAQDFLSIASNEGSRLRRLTEAIHLSSVPQSDAARDDRPIIRNSSSGFDNIFRLGLA